MSLSSKEIRDEIDQFLYDRLHESNRLPKEERSLGRLQESGDEEKIEKQLEKIENLKARFQRENWLDDAATRRFYWIAVASHVSKGIHPDSQGDNIILKFDADKRSDEFVSSHTVPELSLDATGNAAALDIFAFLNLKVGNQTIMDLINNEDPAMREALSNDKDKADLYLQNFKKLVAGNIESPTSHERNKQILWPLEGGIASIDEDQYRQLVPLHPSSLSNYFYHRVNNRRYSEENRKNRENRWIKGKHKREYLDMLDLAYIKLGGSNPQGVSQLNSNQGGRNLLLPSIPPEIDKEWHRLPKREDKTIFNDSLFYRCREFFNEIVAVVNDPRNIKSVRDRRKDAFSRHLIEDFDEEKAFDDSIVQQSILMEIATTAKTIQQKLDPNWSVDYQLKKEQKLWLDPYRTEEINGEDFQELRIDGTWIESVMNDFANWVNIQLRALLPKEAKNINDNEMKIWKREMKQSLMLNQRRFKNAEYVPYRRQFQDFHDMPNVATITNANKRRKEEQ